VRVLIVDDEERFVRNVARILGLRGFDVRTAADGLQAVETVQFEAAFDVVVLDIKMPVMDGMAALKEIKRRSPETEVIMLTGHATLATGIAAIRAGAYDYLMKPCDMEDLIEKIREANTVERIKRHPVLWPRNRVKDLLLCSFRRLAVDDPLRDALPVFHRKTLTEGVETVYIQDAGDRFRGVVKKNDLLEAARRAHPDRTLVWSDILAAPHLLPPGKLGDVMRPESPLTTTPTARLTAVAQQMIAHNLRCMPVVQKGRVIGIVRMRDILEHVEHETQ
jgi:ActR/RegA family two-component response regulator